MFQLTKTRRIIQKIIDIRSINNISNYKHWFYLSQYPGYYFDNFDDLARYKRWSFKDKLINRLKKIRTKRNINSSHRIIIQKTLNGVLLINITKKYISKIIEQSNEPSFLENESIAFKYLPKNVPKILGKGREGKFFYITSEFIRETESFSWDKWSSSIKKVSKVIRQMYLKSPLTKINSDIYVLDISLKLKKSIKSGEYLRTEMYEAVRVLLLCIEKYRINNVSLYTSFQHGDIVPNNILKTKNNIYIVDWANGGRLNCFYDLMMQDFYFPWKSSWKNFEKANLISDHENGYFFDWTMEYIKIFEEKSGTKFNNDQVKLSIILSLAELALKNYFRYQTKDEFRDGRGMIQNVTKICSNILNN